jgi:tetratricopeptide (TPR) repeat protein
MSADFPSNSQDPESAPPEGTSLPPPGGEGGTPEFPRRKIRYRQNENGPAASREQQIVVLSSMLASLMEKTEKPEEPPPKKVFRFAGKPAPPPASSGTAETSAVPTAPLGTDVAGATADRPLPNGNWSFWRPPETPARRRSFGLGYWLLTILIGVAAFLAGRHMLGFGFLSSAPARTELAPRVPSWSESNLTQLDRILEADQAGDLETAARLAGSLKLEAGALPGLEPYLSLLEARKGKLSDALASLTKMRPMLTTGSPLAAVDDASAFTFSRDRRFALASQSFKRCALAEPFAPENFRRWGESLRREGHQREAIIAFNEALLRYPVGVVEYMDAREYVKYKIRLSQIEGGLPVDTRTASADSEMTANSFGYWFLTDASVALQQGDFRAAAAALQKAKETLPGSLFDVLLGDYMFRAYATRPEVASFFPADPFALSRQEKSRRVYFIDP